MECETAASMQIKVILLTSKDWAYQFFTLFIEGIALRLWGSSSSSLTRCARRTGSSSDKRKNESLKGKSYKRTSTPARNWLALNKVPWLGFWPKRTICCRETWVIQRWWHRKSKERWTYPLFGETTQNGESCPIAQELYEILQTCLSVKVQTYHMPTKPAR